MEKTEQERRRGEVRQKGTTGQNMGCPLSDMQSLGWGLGAGVGRE